MTASLPPPGEGRRPKWKNITAAGRNLSDRRWLSMATWLTVLIAIAAALLIVYLIRHL